MELKYHAIILAKADVGETDRIYTVYTREAGRLSFLAAGVRKPNARLAGNLEPLTYSQIFVARSRGRGKITGVISEENFSRIKSDIFSLERIFNIFSILTRLITQEEKDEKNFALLLGYLKIMETLSEEGGADKSKAEIVTAGFLLRLLDNLGYGLEMKKCAACGANLTPGENFFSPKNGGVLCSKCAREEVQNIKISDEAIKLIRVILENKIENLVKIKAEKESINNLKRAAAEAVGWVTE